MTVSPRLAATVSGSFRRSMRQVQEAVYALTDNGVRVLSPADPRVVDELGSFLFVASDRLRSVKLVQQRHLEAIAGSDFLWLVCPEGYVGLSAAMEVGFAAAVAVPVFSDTAPADLTLRQFVTVVDNAAGAIREVGRKQRPKLGVSVLVDPPAAVEDAHRRLDGVRRTLAGGRSVDPSTDLDKALAGIKLLGRGA
jgi:hypothetical protein